MSDTTTARKIAKDVLAKHGFQNKLKARMSTFNCIKHGNTFVVVEIHDWQPAPIADTIKTEIVETGNSSGIGIIAQFHGNFVQG